MSFGWSVGDIVQAVKALHNLIQALDSVSGAARDYREAVTFLNDLSNTLKPLQHSEALEADVELRDAIKEQVKAIKGPVEEFLQVVGKFKQSLGLEAARGCLRNIPRKLQWHYSTSLHVTVLRDKVDRHLRILDTLFQQSTMGLIYRLPSEMRGIFHQVLDERLASALEQSLRPLEASITAQWSAIDRGPEALVAYLQNNNSLKPFAIDAMLETIRKPYLGNVTPKLLMGNLEGPVRLSPIMSQLSTECTPTSLEPQKSGDDTKYLFSQQSRCRVEDVRVSRQIISRLTDWWRPGPALLWIQEGFRRKANEPSQISMAVRALAEETDIPVFWHACRQQIDEEGRDVIQKAIFMELLNSLLNQIRANSSSLKDYEVAESGTDMTPPPEMELDVKGSIQNSINLLQLHITQTKSASMFVLDGLNCLDYSDDKEVEDGLQNLLDLLYHPGVPATGVVKTLLTTQGQTLFLLDRISFQDKVNAATIGSTDDEILTEGMRREVGIT